MNDTQIERHPLKPFLPADARVLLLGSFPPPHRRWSMEFFYPNFNNDFWRIVGLLFYNDKLHFITEGEKKFDCEKIKTFCESAGIALFDTATAVIRTKANASDKDLEIVEKTDLPLLLRQIPECRNVACTGEKAGKTFATVFGMDNCPAVGKSQTFFFDEREIRFYRMPSTSRAFPAPLEKKAVFYREIFLHCKCNLHI